MITILFKLQLAVFGIILFTRLAGIARALREIDNE